MSKGYFLKGSLKNGFTNGTYRRLKFINSGSRWHPPGFHVEFCNPAIVTLEKGQKILCQITLINWTQCSHDSEIDCLVTSIAVHKDITGMHIRVKKIMAEYLGEKYFYAIF